MIHNTADTGGGLYQCSGPVINCTIANNQAIRGGGMAECRHIENCIVWANQDAQLYRCDTPVYSCIQDGQTGNNNINLDPEFIDPQQDDYHLFLGSACIDKGNPQIQNVEFTDLDGAPRVIDQDKNGTVIIDMGAYETPVSNQPVIGVSDYVLSFQITDDQPQTKILNVWNAGADVIDYTLSHNCTWLKVHPDSGSSADNIDNIEIAVDPNGLQWGRYQCQLQVHAASAINSPRTVLVDLIIMANQIYLTPHSIPIQTAVDSLVDGGTLILADGIYTGPGNRDIRFHGKSITLRSENGPQSCVIDPNGTQDQPYRALILDQGEDSNTVIEGITFQNGYCPLGGGAVYCEQASPRFRNCVFMQNIAHDDDGGAVQIRYGSPCFQQCVFLNNNAEQGAGLYAEDATLCILQSKLTGNMAELGGGIYTENTHPVIDDCIFENNIAENGGALFMRNSDGKITHCLFNRNTATYEYWQNGGAAIYNVLSHPVIRHCQFEENTSAWDGGAVFNYRSNPHIEQCRFEKNMALANDGGALFNVSDSDPNIIRCRFINNRAGSWGGAIRNRQSSPYIQNTLFIENFAIDNGGAIFNFFQSSPTIVHSTFSRNSANGNSGGGIYNFNECESTIYNSILWDNESTEIEDETSQSRVYYNCIEGNIRQFESSNINKNPRFNNPDQRDYHLKKDSPCIDAARKSLIHQDLEGTFRPWDYPYSNPAPSKSAFDIGAYEFINHRPTSDPGPDQIAYAGPDGFAAVRLDASDSYDPDEQALYYRWTHYAQDGHTYHFNTGDGFIDLHDLSALCVHWAESGDSFFDISGNKDQFVGIEDLLNLADNWLTEINHESSNWPYDLAPSEPNITIQLPVGEHRLELTVNDTIAYSKPEEIQIHVIESIQVSSWIVPPHLNMSNDNQRIIAKLRLPVGITEDHIDTDYSLRLAPDQPALLFKVFDSPSRVTLMGHFRIGQIPAEDRQNNVLQITGRLKSGQYFHTSKPLTQTFH